MLRATLVLRTNPILPSRQARWQDQTLLSAVTYVLVLVKVVEMLCLDDDHEWCKWFVITAILRMLLVAGSRRLMAVSSLRLPTPSRIRPSLYCAPLVNSAYMLLLVTLV